MKTIIKFGALVVISALILTIVLLVDVIISELEPISVIIKFVVIGEILLTIYLVAVTILLVNQFIQHLKRIGLEMNKRCSNCKKLKKCKRVAKDLFIPIERQMCSEWR